MRALTAAALALGTACAGPAEPPPAAPSTAHRVFDPRDAGASLPPVGRSLFDHLVADASPDGRVPFPFDALVAAIERRTGPGGTARVLIPRGRSLQRDAAAPDFFAFPRAVVAATRDGDRKLADRLFVAYQERAAVLEVVSYNEAAGRFEFQVVREYRAGVRPRVVYASRELCTACHQNGGPIFARPLWDETNASAETAARLRDERGAFYGIAARADVDAAYAVDNATDRGNLLAAYQLLWSDGCGTGDAGRRCRAELLADVLARRLSDLPSPAVPDAARAWAVRFPHGLLLPNADLPNRVPAHDYAPPPAERMAVPVVRSPDAQARLAELIRASDVPPPLEPLQPRPPGETWAPGDLLGPAAVRAAGGLGTFLTDDDARRLDDRLAAEDAPAAHIRAACTVATAGTRVSFDCRPDRGGGFALSGRVHAHAGGTAGGIDSVSSAGMQQTAALDARGPALQTVDRERRLTLALRSALSGRRARLADGRRLVGLSLRWTGSGVGSGELAVADDGPVLRRAALAAAADAADPLGGGPFRRSRVLGALDRALGLPLSTRCCEDAAALPPAAVDGTPSAVAPGDPLALLRRHCGRCHDTPDRFPPNFLHGPEAPSRVAHCAERIAFRLAMWALPPAERTRTPMPPTAALPVPVDLWPSHPDYGALRGAVPGVRVSGRDYASLAPCLADDASPTTPPPIHVGLRNP